jgi:lysozyme family protein
MANFEPAIEITLKNEGGLVDDPADPGGLTKFGLSQRSYPNVDIKNLTIEDAKAIYLKDFWKFGGITDQSIANKIFDSYVNMEHAAIKIAQKTVGFSKQDGVYGPVTETAINSFTAENFLPLYRANLVQHYKDIVAANPEESKFLEGWENRANQ